MSLCQLLSFIFEANIFCSFKRNLEVLVNLFRKFENKRTEPEYKKVTNNKEIVEYLKRIQENSLKTVFEERYISFSRVYLPVFTRKGNIFTTTSAIIHES